MKLSFPILLLLSLYGVLFAQTQSLPDINVSGESEIKAFLYKRTLLFSPLGVEVDSLPDFLPGGPLQEGASAAKKMKHRGYLQLEANTGFGANSYLSFYPGSSALHSVTHQLEMRSPESDMFAIKNNLYLGGDISKTIPLSLKLEFASAKADSFANDFLGLTLSSNRANLAWGEMEINKLSLSLQFSKLNQKNLLSAYNPFFIDFQTAGFLEKEWWNLKFKYLVDSGEGGILLAPRINSEPFGISQIRPHLIADAHSFIPSLGFSYRNPLSNGGVFCLENDPLIEGNGISKMLETTPWMAFSNRNRLQKTPLNLKLGWEFIHPRAEDFSLSRFNFDNTLRYDVHSPILISSDNYGIAAISYNEVVSNISEAGAFFRMGNLMLHQEMQFQLAYLPLKQYIRAPYRPALIFQTSAYYPYLDWLFSFAIFQNYFTTDHTGDHLPEAVVCNLGTEYRKGDSSLYCQLSNVLNQKMWRFSEQPPEKFNLYLGLKHRF